jgi:hypothetical protein
VGAVIEDEGMILEHFIEPRDIVAAPKASYESPAFMR